MRSSFPGREQRPTESGLRVVSLGKTACEKYRSGMLPLGCQVLDRVTEKETVWRQTGVSYFDVLVFFFSMYIPFAIL